MGQVRSSALCPCFLFYRPFLSRSRQNFRFGAPYTTGNILLHIDGPLPMSTLCRRPEGWKQSSECAMSAQERRLQTFSFPCQPAILLRLSSPAWCAMPLRDRLPIVASLEPGCCGGRLCHALGHLQPVATWRR